MSSTQSGPVEEAVLRIGNAVGEQLALQIHSHDVRQMHFTHLMVEAGSGATVRQFATALGFPGILIIEFANPLGGLSF